ALEAAAKLSYRYITDRFLPDKAIDLIDEAASRVRLKTMTTPPELREMEDELEVIRKEKDAAIRAQEFEKAASFRDKEQEVKEKVGKLKERWQKDHKLDNSTVTEEDIAQIVASWTGIPVKRLAEEESERLLNMEEILHNRVIGQDEAVVAIARAIRRAYAGLKDPARPIGSFIFLGPTGVGKTELARALADAMFGDEDAMIRLDMSEYMEKFAVSRMVGAPPGYVGYEEGGELTEKVRRKPYSVVLFDEIEKAHPDVFNILLQILEDGRLTDSKGRTVDFRNTILIMTSNVGANLIQKPKILGFEPVQEEEKSYAEMRDRVLDELKRTFRPEFLNRVDETIVFHSLNEEHIRAIVTLMVNEVNARLTEKEISIDVTDKAKDLLAKEGYDPMYGARPLRRVIQKRIEDRLSEELLKRNISTGDVVLIDADEDELTFNRKELTATNI
ncbi:MAG TPA: AAA domain-containing protein, partial [Clostridiaceae bacterium]|nr:AAA domain-containing protein [Clostridiaceae bacterium]